MKFTKMHGIGNDYVYVNCFEEKIDDIPKLAIAVSERHFGIGSDGLILVCPSDVADVRMDMYNLDGSRGEMCGNGIRCVGKFAYDKGIVDKTNITVETLAGIKKLDMQLNDEGKVGSVTVDMGAPILEFEKVPAVLQEGQTPDEATGALINVPITVNGQEYRSTAVSMGNPHNVIFIGMSEDCPFSGCSLKDIDLEAIGPDFENHPMFPNRVNTEFVNIVDRTHVEMRVWERGSGETLACGTGACAVTVACILNGLTEDEITVSLLGGDLRIRWDREENIVYMTGPATTVFDGVIAKESGLI
jgi:diaminopimelate epimerase